VTSVPALIDTNFVLAAIYIGVMSVALVIGTFGNIMILLVAGYERGLNKVGKQFMVNVLLKMSGIPITQTLWKKNS
jgi:uncharacterized YccA/Bax inhibitor family protein